MSEKLKVATATAHMSGYFKHAFPELQVIGHESNLPKELDLLIMTGGSDVNPSRYGEENHQAYGIDEERDEREFNILKLALSMYPKLKVLGICRGLQLLNVANGGTLYQDLGNKSHRGAHKMKFTESKHPMAWLTSVNSLHHQGILSVGRGRHRYKEVSIVAVEPETGIIEAIAWDDTMFATQFHPEMMSDTVYNPFFSMIREWVNGAVKLNNSQQTIKPAPLKTSWTVSINTNQDGTTSYSPQDPTPQPPTTEMQEALVSAHNALNQLLSTEDLWDAGEPSEGDTDA